MLSGRAVFDLVHNAAISVVLMVSGLAVGWRVNGSVPDFMAGVALLLLFTFAMSWMGIWLRLTMETVDAAQQVGFTIIFPLTFLSNIFVPPETMPPWLQPVAEWNPVSTLPAATRQLCSCGERSVDISGVFTHESRSRRTVWWAARLGLSGMFCLTTLKLLTVGPAPRRQNSLQV